MMQTKTMFFGEGGKIGKYITYFGREASSVICRDAPELKSVPECVMSSDKQRDKLYVHCLISALDLTII